MKISKNNRYFVLKTVFMMALLILLSIPFSVHGGSYSSVCTPDNTWTPEKAKSKFGQPLEITDTVCLDRDPGDGTAKGTFYFTFVNIYGKDGKEGKLIFKDASIDFWAKSILVENGGSLIAGSPEDPIGKADIKNMLTIHLYGDEKDSDGGITCKTDKITCGVPSAPEKNIWEKGADVEYLLDNGVKDYFYKYSKLPTDDDLGDKAYFGRKALALSYGGVIRLFGKRGAKIDPSNAGESWVRLAQTVNPGEMTIKVDRPVDWMVNDWIVVTTTDYLPGHSEKIKIDDLDSTKMMLTIDKIVDGKNVDIEYPHNGSNFSLADVPKRLRDKGFKLNEVENRAAVALLTRNIQIVSEKCGNYNVKECQGMPEEPGTYFGGHTIIRQGFKQYQVQGVEFRQLGQGGRMAHAPINFHLIRQAPKDTFVRDCSINESMTHWIELRGTQNVLLERNVGYNSIGHGYFLSDGTETNNILKGNIGIHARAAVNSVQNPRQVPGIISMTANDPHVRADPNTLHPAYAAEIQAYRSDAGHPAVFHITNAYNTFEDNMAAGAGTCGACYWIVPSKISGLSLQANMKWKGYAGIQANTPGTAPLKSFKGNFCSTAQHSLMTIGGTGVCEGLSDDPKAKSYLLAPFPNPFTKTYVDQDLYPRTSNATTLQSAVCDDASGDCSGVTCVKGQTGNCAVNVIESYTSSFHWAQTNFAAIWLRTNWFLMTDSVLTDALHGGLTMVSGGSYDQVINGYWALTRNSVFIGNTQPWDTSKTPPGNPYTTPAGPFHRYAGGLACEGDQKEDPENEDPKKRGACKDGVPASACVSKEQGINIPSDTFAVYQRLYSIYDGPVLQENNAYLQIKKTPVDKCGFKGGGCSSNYMYGQCGRGQGIPRAVEPSPGIEKGKCILPNAAIGWKQPNGFYYPPAFHSQNLYFKNVDIRHYIIVPLFEPGTTNVYEDWVTRDYCYYPGNRSALFASDFTDVDRQTELNDDDGSLSGLTGTDPPNPEFAGSISVNKDKFYLTPSLTMECASEQTCFQAPHDYVTAVVYPGQFTPDPPTSGPVIPYCHPCHPDPVIAAKDPYCQDNLKHDNNWCNDCQQRNCYGVPIYRQHYTSSEEKEGKKIDAGQSMRMMGAGIWQRSTMVANLGKYYIDTAISKKTQIEKTPLFGDASKVTHNLNVFEPNKSYNIFLLYAKPATRITFQLYVGKDPKFSADSLRMVRAGTKVKDGDENIVILKGAKLDFTPADFWPTNWQRKYQSDTGILEVTMDMGFDKATDVQTRQLADDFQDKAKQEVCKPQSFCRWDDKVKKCCRADDKAGCEDSICGWTSKTLECPAGGCLGFRVTLPGSFRADDDTGGKFRPPTEPFPASQTVKWGLAGPSLSGDPESCVYKDQPPPIPDDLWKK